MRVKDVLMLHRIGDRYMMVQDSENDVNLTNVITLNETAAFLWKTFSGREFTPDDMVKSLVDEYDVEPEMASGDVSSFIEKIKEYGMLYE